ncbi:MAG: hypothetical protein ACREJ2_00470, partial [Planctomycetota bacterium]
PENLARRSLRAAAEARRSLHRSMRAAAVEASRLSWGAWCWIKFKTQWQFWIILAAAMTGWWFLAQRPALRALHEAHAAYDAKYQQVSNLQDERNRLREIYEPLRRGDPYAWQMLARHQLGWQQESEVISVPHPTENPAGYKADSLRR